MQFFVKSDSIVRRIWGKSDTIIFIFAGSASEFALNKAVDWLYFTGRLPADPISRLFSTVSYARRIVFAELEEANKAIDTITSIHTSVENSRGASIPDWAYRDVLYMLIDYSIRSFELLERKLSESEKREVFDVFYRVGKRMALKELPDNYEDWLRDREKHMKEDLLRSHFTDDLYRQYRKHLGLLRYQLLLQAQLLVIPDHVKKLLRKPDLFFFKPLLAFYKLSRIIKIDGFLKEIILPSEHKDSIKELDINPA